MRLSKIGWILLTVGIFAVMFVSLGATESQQIDQQNQLNEELLLAKQRLSNLQLEQLSSQQEELEKQLNQIISQAQFQAAKAILSQPANSIALSSTLFDIAETCGVEVTEIKSIGQATGDLGEITCSVLPVTVTVEGDVPKLISFITKLNEEFATGVVKSIATSIPETLTEEVDEATSEETDETAGEETVTPNKKPSAKIQLTIYSYQGD